MIKKTDYFRLTFDTIFKIFCQHKNRGESSLILNNKKAFSPVVCAELLQAFKNQFSTREDFYYDFFMIFETLTTILQKFPQFAADILEISKLIFERYEKLSAGLIINIAHKSPELIKEAEALLTIWLQRERYDEGALVNFYQFLGLFLQAHPKEVKFVEAICETALKSTKNKKYALKEVALLKQHIKAVETFGNE